MTNLRRCGLGALVLAACSAATAGTSTGGPDAASSTGSGGSSGSPDAGLADSGPRAKDGGGLGPGEGCDPAAVIDPCQAAGLLCNPQTAVCELPSLGEPCTPDAGCAATPSGLGCHGVSVGAPALLCLVPCTNADSSACPYGTSCGDPNLPGFCSQNGSPNCAIWRSCTLGPDLFGLCVPNGTYNTCLASGEQHGEYGTCDPSASNADVSALCGPGAACELWSSDLTAAAAAGFCFPLCGADGGSCAANEHCDQASPAAYGVCRPGLACGLDVNTCPAQTACVPDRLSELTGGCLPLAADAGALGAPCQPPQGVATVSVCQSGLCLSSDGGGVCTAPCDLADGGRPYCVDQVCSPLASMSAVEVIGACR